MYADRTIKGCKKKGRGLRASDAQEKSCFSVDVKVMARATGIIYRTANSHSTERFRLCHADGKWQ